MRIALVLAAVLLPGGAMAFCQPAPDSAASHYVGNATAQTLCLQDELARATARIAEQARLDAMLAEMQDDLRRQRDLLELQSRSRFEAWPGPAF